MLKSLNNFVQVYRVQLYTFRLCSVTRRNELYGVDGLAARSIQTCTLPRVALIGGQSFTQSHLRSGLTSFIHKMTTGSRFMSVTRQGDEDLNNSSLLRQTRRIDQRLFIVFFPPPTDGIDKNRCTFFL